MAGHKKCVASVLVIACMLTCSARQLHSEEEIVRLTVQPDDVVQIKGTRMSVDLDMDDPTKSSSVDQNPTSTDRVSDQLTRMTINHAESSTNKLVFARLPRGPVPPSGPSTDPPCYNPEECHD